MGITKNKQSENNEGIGYDNLFDFVYTLIANVLNDGEKKSVD